MPSSSRPSLPRTTTHKLLLLSALFLTLGLLTDNHENDSHHSALLTALSRHPPSLRVFRFVFVGMFMLLSGGMALLVWEQCGLGEDVGRLLFEAVVCCEEDENDDATDGDNIIVRIPKSSQHDQQQVVVAAQSSVPSSLSVLQTVLDISILSCASLLGFTVASSEGGRYISLDTSIIDDNIAIHHDEGIPTTTNNNDNTNGYYYLQYFCEATAPLFPLSLFCVLIWKATFPWKIRGNVWFTLIGRTVGAPFYDVTFRDGFIGDIITSAVRPLQDLLFTLFFVPLGLRAYWSYYNVDDNATAVPIERNWFLHTLLLPACTLSPQWWRFCQNLRQTYDAKKRWPYLGNAMKYMAAAQVATFGMFDPSVKHNPLWITSFALATLYQVWWDVCMDWGLVEWNSIQRTVTLRTARLYKWTWVYYVIFVINFLLRFVGMITLIPPVHLSRTTGLIVRTFPDFGMFVGSLAACAEIFRRTVWALLRLEWEVIKIRNNNTAVGDVNHQSSFVVPDNNIEKKENEEDELSSTGLDYHENDMQPMAIESSIVTSTMRLPNISLKSFWLSDMSDLNDIQILTELCAWATVFSGIAIVAAAHREIL